MMKVERPKQKTENLFYKMYRELQTLILYDIGCVHYISIVHLCDVWCMFYGNIMKSF